MHIYINIVNLVIFNILTRLSKKQDFVYNNKEKISLETMPELTQA